MNTMTVRDAASIWGLSERRVAILCKEGRIKGAYKQGRSWIIPADAKKPADNRSARKSSVKKSLPIGISEYRKAVSKYYYIDKTLLIKELIDEGAAVSLFTRPRRFGKTLNMDMLREFFEISDEDTAAYFRDKQIWSQGEEYQKEQGKYPVVFVSFKDIKCSNWEETYALLYKIIRSEFLRHSELRLSEKLDEYDKEYIERILGHSAEKNDLTLSFRELSRMLHIHHGVPPVIIIDEYDIPIQQGHMKGF